MMYVYVRAFMYLCISLARQAAVERCVYVLVWQSAVVILCHILYVINLATHWQMIFVNVSCLEFNFLYVFDLTKSRRKRFPSYVCFFFFSIWWRIIMILILNTSTGQSIFIWLMSCLNSNIARTTICLNSFKKYKFQ